MTVPLALKYRPQTFHDLVGQPVSRWVMMGMIHERQPDGSWKPRGEPDLAPGLLLTGQRGSGKTSSARILAAALNCEHPVERPCTQCPSCRAVASGRSLAVMEVDAASNGGVEQIRRLRDLVSYQAPGEWRVVILDEVQSMSRDAWNAMLKVLEEPPPSTVFAMLTTEPSKVLPTVISRCIPLTFRRVALGDIVARLQHICSEENIQAEPGLIGAIAGAADGALRDAVMALDRARLAGVRTAEAWRALAGETDFAPRLIGACATGEFATIFGVLTDVLDQRADYPAIGAALVHCLTDLLVLQCGGTIQAQGDELDRRKLLAGSLDKTRIVDVLRVFWDLRTRVTGDARSSLELALVMASEKLHSRSPVDSHQRQTSNGHAAVSNQPARRTLSVQEMTAAARGET